MNRNFKHPDKPKGLPAWYYFIMIILIGVSVYLGNWGAVVGQIMGVATLAAIMKL